MKTLKVYPNPWGVHPLSVKQGTAQPHVGLDQFGRPAHAVLTQDNGQIRSYVGAKINADKTRVFALDLPDSLKPLAKFDDARSPRQETAWQFNGIDADDPDFCAKFAKTQPVEVPLVGEYIALLKSGDLLPGDGVAANLAGYHCQPSEFAALEAYAKRHFAGGAVEQPKPAPAKADRKADS